MSTMSILLTCAGVMVACCLWMTALLVKHHEFKAFITQSRYHPHPEKLQHTYHDPQFRWLLAILIASIIVASVCAYTRG